MWRTSSLVSPASLASPPPLQDQLWEVAPLSQMPLHVHWWVRRAPGPVLPESLISPCSTRVIPAQSSALRPVHAEVRKHSFLLEGGLSQQTPFPDTAGEPAPSGSVPAHAPRLGVPRKGPDLPFPLGSASGDRLGHIVWGPVPAQWGGWASRGGSFQLQNPDVSDLQSKINWRDLI